MLVNVIDTTENCRYCLMCRHIAPLARVSSDEALTPRGIALAVASQRRGLLDWNPEMVAIMFSETDGGNSRAHCVFDQPLEEAIAAVRAELVASGLAPAAVVTAGKVLREQGSLFGNSAALRQMTAEPTTATADALFAGDEAVFLWPEALDAAAALLSAVGVSAELVGEGGGNGFLAQTLGFPATAAAQVGQLIAAVEAREIERLFVLGPGDCYALTTMIDERLGLGWPEGSAIFDLVPFLAECLADGNLRLSHSPDQRPWAYVDPTHAVRVPDRFDAPRALAAAVLRGPQRELFWRRERAHPVGNTGIIVSRPDLAQQLTRARLEDARTAGAELIVCEDPGTLAMLAPLAADYGLTALGLYELLAGHIVA